MDTIIALSIALISTVLLVLVYVQSQETKQHNETSTALIYRYAVVRGNRKKVSVKSGNKLSTDVTLTPVEINVLSGQIAQTCSIVSHFHEGEEIVKISKDTIWFKDLKSMHHLYNDRIVIMPTEATCFHYVDGKPLFFETYLIVDTNAKRHLLMFWYDGTTYEEGVLDRVRATASAGNEQDYFRQQFRYLVSYFTKQGLEIA